jgi:hypothetical protein
MIVAEFKMVLGTSFGCGLSNLSLFLPQNPLLTGHPRQHGGYQSDGNMDMLRIHMRCTLNGISILFILGICSD